MKAPAYGKSSVDVVAASYVVPNIATAIGSVLTSSPMPHGAYFIYQPDTQVECFFAYSSPLLHRYVAPQHAPLTAYRLPVATPCRVARTGVSKEAQNADLPSPALRSMRVHGCCAVMSLCHTMPLAQRGKEARQEAARVSACSSGAYAAALIRCVILRDADRGRI